MFNRLHKEESGFTLIELLIVIAILAILSMVAVPKFINMRANAIVDACKTNLAALSTAVEQYDFYNSQDSTVFGGLSTGASTFLTELQAEYNFTPPGTTTSQPVRILKNTTVCPASGVYTLQADMTVTCSVAGHSIIPAT